MIRSLNLVIAQAEDLKVDTPILTQKLNQMEEALLKSSDATHEGAISKIEFL
jgi:hypothetical protein